MTTQSEPIECCICMDVINSNKNNCTTPCGHSFCFKCLAKSLEKKNTCPCCRAVLMEDQDDEDDDDFYEDDGDEESETESELTILSSDEEELDDVLTSFRMFCQRINGEEIEDDPYVIDANDEATANGTDTDEDEPLAEVEAITARLQSFGITMLDLVAMLTDRKSKLVEKHTDQFIDAIDIIIDNAMTDCDKEVRDAAAQQQSSGEAAI